MKVLKATCCTKLRTHDFSSKSYIYIYIIIRALVLVVSALIGTLLFSPSTSPLYSGYGYDSAMFQTIGKYWAQGYLPYVDFFDHKGPIIFFINAIGYAIGGRNGVFSIQVAVLTLCEYLAYKLLRTKLKRSLSFALAVLMPVLLSAVWMGGNTTEEYILPLLFASYYKMLLWSEHAQKGRFEHSCGAAFLYGVTFSFATLTRITNAIGICVGIAFISVVLIVKGFWKNILKNALSFILGFFMLTTPFCVYFYLHDAHYDMWYGTIFYNIVYAGTYKDAIPSSFMYFLRYIRRCFFGFALIFASLWSLIFRRDGRIFSLLWFISSFSFVAFLYTQNDYDHYAICLLPMYYLAICEMHSIDMKKTVEKLTKIFCCLMCVFVFASCMYKIYNSFIVNHPTFDYEYYGDECESLIALLPEDGRESFVAIDCPRSIYLEYDLCPALRFFTLQTWMGSNNVEFLDMFCKELDESNVRWILYMDVDKPRIPELISKKYELVGVSKYGVFKLYTLK